MPNFFIAQAVEMYLKRAHYEHDKKTGEWCAWVEGLPGAYAQADTVESVRNQLAEVVEDYMLVSLYNRNPIPEFQRFAHPLQYEARTD